jgi:hypothetical protein
LAWEGDLRGRRHLLNPDDLALEVMRYEKAHLSLTENLDSVLHQLAALPFTGGTIRNPLFVLPVDDFDLNPPACLDLLRVLRMLALPRLFFLVLGDLDVANVLLNLKLSAELGRVAEGAEASRMLSLPPADVAAMAGEVAANAIRKLIPPAQRIQLAVPSLLEALNFRPLGHRDEDPYLHELLARCPTYVFQSSQWNLQRGRRTHEGDLRKMLLAAGGHLLNTGGKQESIPDHAPLGEGHLLHGCYTARRLLCAPSRQVSDLWYGLKRLVEAAPRVSSAAKPENEPREDSEDKSPGGATAAAGRAIEYDIHRLSQMLFAQTMPPWQLQQLRQDLADPTALKRAGFPDGPGVDGRCAPFADMPTTGRDRQHLLYRYLTDSQLFQRGREIIWVEPLREAISLEFLQTELRRKLGQRGIVVEINPTSNLLIGDLEDLTSHPLWRLKPPRPRPTIRRQWRSVSARMTPSPSIPICGPSTNACTTRCCWAVCPTNRPVRGWSEFVPAVWRAPAPGPQSGSSV